jgi:hypothetical protein
MNILHYIHTYILCRSHQVYVWILVRLQVGNALALPHQLMWGVRHRVVAGLQSMQPALKPMLGCHIIRPPSPSLQRSCHGLSRRSCNGATPSSTTTGGTPPRMTSNATSALMPCSPCLRCINDLHHVRGLMWWTPLERVSKAF